MTVGKLALDVWAATVALSLISIVAFGLLAAAVSALTIASARRRARAHRRRAQALARCCSVRALAELDDELDRFWESHRGMLTGPASPWRAGRP